MATPVTYTIGSDASRDYSSLANWAADWGVGISDDLTVDDEIWTIECYNDDGAYQTESSTITCDAITTDSTRTVTVKPASGNGAGGDPNDHRTRAATAALIDDPSVGYAVNGTYTYGSLFEVTNSGTHYWNFEGLQLYCSSTNSALFGLNTGHRGTVDGCLLRQDRASSTRSAISFQGDASRLSNTLVITINTNRDAIFTAYASAEMYNVAAVFIGTWTSTSRYGFSQGSGTAALLKNCLAMNFINGGTDYGFDTGFDASSDYNASEGSTAPGSNSLDLTGGNSTQFVSPLNSASGDFRLKSGNEIAGQGIAITGITTDVRGVSWEDPPAIGAVEADPSGSTTYTTPDFAPTGTSVFSAAGSAVRAGAFAPTGAGSFAATGTKIKPGTFAATGTSVFAAVGVHKKPGTFAATGTSVFAATGQAVRKGAFAPIGTSVFAAVGTHIEPGGTTYTTPDFAPTGTSAFSATGTHKKPGTFAATGTSIFAAAGQTIRKGVFAPIGTSVFAAVGTVSGVTPGTFAPTGTSIFSAAGSTRRVGTFAVTGTSAFANSGIRIAPGTFAATGAGTFAGVGQRVAHGQMAVTGVGLFANAWNMRRAGAMAPVGTSIFSATGSWSGAVSLVTNAPIDGLLDSSDAIEALFDASDPIEGNFDNGA